MSVFDSVVVLETILSALGENYYVRVFDAGNRNFFAMTSLGGKDVIITDGKSVEEALERHRNRLPLAIGSRKKNWDLYEKYCAETEP